MTNGGTLSLLRACVQIQDAEKSCAGCRDETLAVTADVNITGRRMEEVLPSECSLEVECAQAAAYLHELAAKSYSNGMQPPGRLISGPVWWNPIAA